MVASLPRRDGADNRGIRYSSSLREKVCWEVGQWLGDILLDREADVAADD